MKQTQILTSFTSFCILFASAAPNYPIGDAPLNRISIVSRSAYAPDVTCTATDEAGKPGFVEKSAVQKWIDKAITELPPLDRAQYDNTTTYNAPIRCGTAKHCYEFVCAKPETSTLVKLCFKTKEIQDYPEGICPRSVGAAKERMIFYNYSATLRQMVKAAQEILASCKTGGTWVNGGAFIPLEPSGVDCKDRKVIKKSTVKDNVLFALGDRPKDMLF